MHGIKIRILAVFSVEVIVAHLNWHDWMALPGVGHGANITNPVTRIDKARQIGLQDLFVNLLNQPRIGSEIKLHQPVVWGNHCGPLNIEQYQLIYGHLGTGWIQETSGSLPRESSWPT